MKKLLLGNEAVALGAFEAGVTVATAYPGTPSTEITEALAKFKEIYCEWSPNEKVALEVALGSAIAGARSICSMKHVGLNVAADPLFTSSYTGINAGLVIVVADDPDMHSSQNEQDSRHYARAAKLPMLEPSDSQECRDYVVRAFEISEEFDCPVIIRLVTRIAHSRSIVEYGDRAEVELKPYTKNPGKYVMMPAMARLRHVVVEKRMQLLTDYSMQSALNKVETGTNGTGFITSGISYQYVKEAVSGTNAEHSSFLKLGMVYPISKKLMKDFAASVNELFIVEELDPFIEDYARQFGIPVKGKELLPITGELSSSIIKKQLLNRSSESINISDPSTPLADNYISDLPVRPPVLCPGCPHRGAFYVLNKLKLTVSGDIGCYTLGAMPPLQAMDSCICMGASISMAHGIEKARGRESSRKTVSVIGDSTFIHSGITGLIDIVYNKGCSTVIILDNGITGMTGHQHHPASGFNIRGEPAGKVDFEKLAAAIGVKRIKVADPLKIKEFEKIVREEIEADEASVIIARSPCVLLKGYKRSKPVKIVNQDCKKCKLCLKFGCPALADEGGQIRNDDSLCTGCGLCMQVCKNGSIKMAGIENE